ncbi:NUDIX domain-containing protein [Streptomyces sp. NPDC050788]|uniref:NUDIX hydrolase n=1 Tax=Streptomyces sp. NPDC050788 TaxID=3155041 RepID=UPI003412953F
MKQRFTSRVLLVDESDRVLLLCGRDPRKPGARWWFTAGGGLEEGEDYPQAAVREVREETALTLPVQRLSPVVWTRQAIFTVDGQCFDQYEEYRLARITSAEAGAMDIDTVEARYGHHWWTIEELATTSETIRPKRLAVLLADALTSGTHQLLPVHLGDFNEDTDPE